MINIIINISIPILIRISEIKVKNDKNLLPIGWLNIL